MKIRKAASLVTFVALAGCSASPQGETGENSQGVTATAHFQYGYDPSGAMTSSKTDTTSVPMAKQGDVLTAGGSTYHFDALGRVVSIDDLALTYGPDGHMAKAVRGAQTVSYLYDENGERIEKLVNGVAAMAYVGDKRITPTSLEEPVRLGNQHIGILRNAGFSLLATDKRGTVLADTNGTQRLPSPFGQRAPRPDGIAAPGQPKLLVVKRGLLEIFLGRDVGLSSMRLPGSPCSTVRC